MRDKAGALIGHARQTLPEGTASVGIGLAVAAVTSYIYVVVSLNALVGGAAAAFSAFWAVIFVAGTGFFLPLEQEVGRAVAHRRARRRRWWPARASRSRGSAGSSRRCSSSAR